MHHADMSVSIARKLFTFLLVIARNSALVPSTDPARNGELVKPPAQQVAAAIGVSQPTYSGWESGARRPKTLAAVQRVLEYLGMMDRFPIMAEIWNVAQIELNKREQERELARSGGHVIGMMDQAELLPALERFAVSADVYAAYGIPSVLHTEATAQADLASGVYYRPDFNPARALELRMNRKQCLLREQSPLRLTIYLDEWALMRPIGGYDVLRGQLHYLLTLGGELEHLTIRVVPGTITERPTGGNGLTVMRFTDTWRLGYSESAMRANFGDSLDEIEACGRSMGRYDSIALSPEQSHERITRAIKEVETR